ncbi:uncharacterized protein LOC126908247 [Daktulosphaira vitifoliae]|uniref:uncharacterized protein LOC126908247 n=1 Tax=Daktulosphaira vitifoliae TaxID=58002 RepID=UPI0021AA7486|nr:uncharacterized protein LOC126908247 [Daktulosphaira vitifoliae]
MGFFRPVTTIWFATCITTSYSNKGLHHLAALLLVHKECVEAKTVARQSNLSVKVLEVENRATEPEVQLGTTACVSKLPDIPLPKFDGELKNWPDFRDRFKSLIHQRPSLTNVDKFYYLLSCLQGDPSEVLKGITVAEETYAIAWSTLIETYDKPRLAVRIIEDMLKALVSGAENVTTLQQFLTTFDEGIATLNAMKIPDFASFLLFSIAARCLPANSRRLFETDNTREYPVIEDVIKFVKARINILENAGPASLPSSALSKPAQVWTKKPNANDNKKYIQQHERRVAFLSTAKGQKNVKQSASSGKCYCCAGTHALKDCIKFRELNIDGRYDVVCKFRLCLVCFDQNHMSYKCPSACSIC